MTWLVTRGWPSCYTLGDTQKLEMNYGTKLNPKRSLRTNRGVKGTRQKVISRLNPSEMDQNQLLLVGFPNLGSNDVIVPGICPSAMTCPRWLILIRTLMSNVGRAIVKELAVKFEGNEILSMDDYDVLACYQYLLGCPEKMPNVWFDVSLQWLYLKYFYQNLTGFQL